MNDKPKPKCEGCGRTAACARMKDGTVYRPFAWVYEHADEPLLGLCGECQARRQADGGVRGSA